MCLTLPRGCLTRCWMTPPKQHDGSIIRSVAGSGQEVDGDLQSPDKAHPAPGSCSSRRPGGCLPCWSLLGHEFQARHLLARAATRATLQRLDRVAERRPERLPHASMDDVDAILAAAWHDHVVPTEARRLPSGRPAVHGHRGRHECSREPALLVVICRPGQPRQGVRSGSPGAGGRLGARAARVEKGPRKRRTPRQESGAALSMA